MTEYPAENPPENPPENTVDNLFKDSLCPIDAVAKVDFDFSVACDISPAPTPGTIFGCIPPIIIKEPANDVGLRCPIFYSESEIKVGYAGTNPASGGTCAPESYVKLCLAQQQVDPCTYDLKFDLNIAIPRPPCEVTVSPGEFALRIEFDDCLLPNNTINVRKESTPAENCDDPDKCEFFIDIELDIPIPRTPCPVINTKNFQVTTSFTGSAVDDACTDGKTNKFEITTDHTPGTCTEPGTCTFDFDVEIFIPIPRTPCPDINITSFDVASGYDLDDCLAGRETRFEIVTKHQPPANCNDAGSCAFEIDLEIVIPIPTPPCPVINQTIFDVTTSFIGNVVDVACTNNKKTAFSITTNHVPATCNTAPICEFDVALEIFVPIPRTPCPIINDPSLEVSVGYAGQACVAGKTNSFTITTKHTEPDNCTDAGQCEFEIALELVVPIPEPTCPVINRKSFEVVSSFVGADVDADCIDGAQNKFELTARTIPGTCTTPPRCEFDIELEIFIPIPRTPCPEINITSFSVDSGYDGGELSCLSGNNTFSITTRHTPPTSCDDPGQCAFDLALEIVVPIPEPTCPVINAKNFQVTTSFTGESVDAACTAGKTNKFAISTRHIPATCTEAPKCEFDVELEIFVPIPRTPCPEIVIDGFEVTSGFSDGDCLSGKSNRFEVTTNHVPPASCTEAGECSFAMELEIAVPIPRVPCPTISNSGFSVTTGFSDSACMQGAKNAFSITTNHTPGETCTDPGQCAFDVALEIAVPIPRTPCPNISTTFSQDVYYNNACSRPASKFELTKTVTPGDCTTPDQCDFALALELNIPIPTPPCPELNVSGFAVNVGYAGTSCVAGKSNQFSITPTVVQNPCGANTCRFDIEAEITVPIPQPPCVEISTGKFSVNVGYASCTPTASQFSITKTTTPAAGCDVPEKCDYTIDLEVNVPIPVPRCPTISSSLSTKVHYADAPGIVNGVSVITKHTPPSCNDPGTCSFDIPILVDVPIPRPPCPVVTASGGTIRAGYDVNTNVIFVAVPNNTTNVGTNSPPACATTLVLDIGVRIPRPPCTNVSAQLNVNPLPLGSSPSGGVVVVSNLQPGESCEVELLFDLNIPISCYPDIGAVIGTIHSGLQYSNFITPIVHRIGDCSFNISIFGAVKALTECPTIQQGSFTVTKTGSAEYSPVSSGFLTANSTQSGNGCLITLSGGLNTVGLSGGTGKVGPGYLGKTSTRIQNGQIITDIDLTVAGCADGSGGGGTQGPPGDKGDKGDKGDQGLQGIQGMQGVAGANGQQGPAGPAGALGPRGPIGPRGPAGPQGAPGAEGPQGEQGDEGPTGPEGPSGVTGVTGATGCAGQKGDPGPQGPQGQSGVQGAAGARGDVGPAGPQGVMGPQGAQGATGAQGETGVGEQGPRGEQGATGAQGQTGVTGPVGPIGLEGPVGQQGPQGATGAQGPAGALGMTGLTGPAGPRGAAGARGETGQTGITGPQGPQGLQGIVGPQGATGVSVTGATGATGIRGIDGPEGPPGPMGLQGAQGQQGVTGPQGPQGARGQKGDRGERGVAGMTGLTGPVGRDGVPGPRGAQGSVGPEGPRGATGAVGATGVTGITGVTGATGVGATGPTGPTGPAPQARTTDDSSIIEISSGDEDSSGNYIWVPLHAATGATGPCGRDGSTGPRGFAGPTGVQGPTGVNGATGPTGPYGSTGATGPLPTNAEIAAAFLVELQNNTTFRQTLKPLLEVLLDL